MHNSKKSSKQARVPKPIKIKKEKTEDGGALHPMSYYIDDRLELTKQIFSTLKPKTITNLAPDFIKNNSLEEIEEICLNELLGISTKRLLSIINATKCPTDTESSSDSDVNNIEEHISLEEISSDSEAEKSTKQAKKKSSTATADDGKISVLELLELQARARAIRSQLALEPVTKIDVDSGDETNDSNIAAQPKKRPNEENKSNRTEKTKATEPVKQTKAITDPTNVTPRKKIKLKRNFRKRSLENESDIETVKEDAILSEKEIKEERHSHSPDVIPIVPETETLYISDSSSDEKLEKNVEKIQEPIDNTCKPKTSEKEDKIGKEIEDGEINDEEGSRMQDESVVPLISDNEKQQKETVENLTIDNENVQIEKLETETENVNIESVKDKSSLAVVSYKDENKEDKPEIDLSKTDNNVVSKTNTDNSGDDIDNDNDNNDDIISIEGGDLESEMSEHLVKEEKIEVKETLNTTENLHDDVITLDDSSDEDCREKLNRKRSESWNARWLKSSKVSKVLATSRLGNRVRDKIKKSKRSLELSRKKAKQEEEIAAKSNTMSTKHEIGTVDQYKELLEMRQKKD